MEARIWAVEVDQICFDHMVRNVGDQLRAGSRLYRAALTGRSGHRKLYVRAGNYSKSAVNTSFGSVFSCFGPLKGHLRLFESSEWYTKQHPTVQFRAETVLVPSMLLDSLAKEADRVDFIELDIQCSEFEVLEASTRVLPQVRALLLETCLAPGLCKGTETWEELHVMLQSRGFGLLATEVAPQSLDDPTELCFDALYVNLAIEPTASLAALHVALDLDGQKGPKGSVLWAVHRRRSRRGSSRRSWRPGCCGSCWRLSGAVPRWRRRRPPWARPGASAAARR